LFCQAPCIGIDFGTQFSSVAVVKGEKAEVIANAQGNHSTPSIVAFSDKEILVGEVAVGQAAKNSNNTIVECKRLLGRKPGDETVGMDSKRWSFSIVPKDGKAGVQVCVSIDPFPACCV
jgi:molecular chaperone DnaK (HSP70)